MYRPEYESCLFVVIIARQGSLPAGARRRLSRDGVFFEDRRPRLQRHNADLDEDSPKPKSLGRVRMGPPVLQGPELEIGLSLHGVPALLSQSHTQM